MPTIQSKKDIKQYWDEIIIVHNTVFLRCWRLLSFISHCTLLYLFGYQSYHPWRVLLARQNVWGQQEPRIAIKDIEPLYEHCFVQEVWKHWLLSIFSLGTNWMLLFHFRSRQECFLAFFVSRPQHLHDIPRSHHRNIILANLTRISTQLFIIIF